MVAVTKGDSACAKPYAETTFENEGTYTRPLATIGELNLMPILAWSPGLVSLLYSWLLRLVAS